MHGRCGLASPPLAAVALVLGLMWPASAWAPPPAEPAGCPSTATNPGFEGLGLRSYPNFNRDQWLAEGPGLAPVTLNSRLPAAVSPNNGVVFPGTSVRVSYETKKVPRSNLTVGIKLALLDAAGRVRRIVARNAESVESRGGELAVRFPRRKLGRFSLAVFAVAAGHSLLPRFKNRYVTAWPLLDPRLALGKDSYAQGEVIRGRLSNFGSVPFLYGVDYSIDRLEPGGWTPVPFDGVFPAIGYSLAGGSSGSCQQIVLPPDLTPGHYRIKKGVIAEPIQAPVRGRDAEAAGEFDLLP
jgi:hypothetical protein